MGRGVSATECVARGQAYQLTGILDDGHFHHGFIFLTELAVFGPYLINCFRKPKMTKPTWDFVACNRG